LKIGTKAFAFVFLLLLIAPLLFLPTSHALNELATAPLIIKLGDDKAIDYTVQKIRMFIPTASVVSINDMKALKSTSQSFAGYTIYVGHGEENGLMVGNNLVSWTNVKTIMKDSPSSTYMLASCYSQAAEVDGKVTFGFQRQVDVDEAAMWAVIMYYSYNKQYDKVPEAIQYFTSVIMDKYQHPERNFIATLDYTSNSYYVEGIWWNIYTDDRDFPIEYTHPDVHNHYSVGLEEEWGIWPEDIGVSHIKKSTLDQGLILPIIASLGTALGMASLYAAEIVSGGTVTIAIAVAAALGATEYWITNS
jgi:hypothetical protein